MEKFKAFWAEINFKGCIDAFAGWVFSLSSRSLELAAVIVLHAMFLPSTMAYLNALTDQLPSLDTYLLALAGMVILNLRAIINQDRVASLIHLTGFIGQLVVIAMILLK